MAELLGQLLQANVYVRRQGYVPTLRERFPPELRDIPGDPLGLHHFVALERCRGDGDISTDFGVGERDGPPDRGGAAHDEGLLPGQIEAGLWVPGEFTHQT